MADKSVGELIAAQSVTPTDLFVLEQNGTAKKLTGQILENWLVSFADGHGGIQSIEKLSTSGLVDTYRITLADTTTFNFVVTNGIGITGISKTSTSGLVDTYTISYNNGTTGTFTVTNGEKGDKGDNSYIWIKYASQEPTESSHSMGDIPDDWIGIYYGNASTAPMDWQQYKWFKHKGEKGDTGSPATLVTKSVTYQVGDSGTIIPSGAWGSSIPVVSQGKYLWTKTELRFNTGDPIVSYSVARMGIDGTGAVSSVAGVSPDATGNVTLTAADVGALAVSGGDMTGAIDMNGQPISGLNPPKTETEPVTKGDGDARYLQKAGGTMAGPIDMAGNGVKNLPLPTENNDPLIKSQIVNSFATTEPGFVADARTVAVIHSNLTLTDLIKQDKYTRKTLSVFGKVAIMYISCSLDETKPFTLYQSNTIASLPEEFAPVEIVSVDVFLRNQVYCTIGVYQDGTVYAQPYNTLSKDSNFAVNLCWIVK